MTCRSGSSCSAACAVALLSGFFGRAALADEAFEPVKELGQMSLSDLSRVEVTSVSKAAQPIGTAAAAIYVISHDDIMRSGAHSIPELLRLAPNLQVNQVSSSSYAISARGFVGNPPDQNFSNKLLILIDGRSVYSPLFSGVFYDQVDVMVEDIERIEVISGPGATLWGANAVNGVINIITRTGSASAGTLVRVAGGNQEQNVAARYGGEAGDALNYRVYGMGFERDALEVAGGASAHDAWDKAQVGFRSDWMDGPQAVTVQGDAYRGTEDQPGALEVPISGANVLARWTSSSAESRLALQAYIDHSEAGRPISGAGFVLNQYDIELQHSLAIGSRNELVWGIGQRFSDYHIAGSSTFFFSPEHRTLSLTNAFVQDTFALLEQLKLIAGVKLEDDPYSHWTAMPDVRIAWSANTQNFLWAAASKAIRSPTPFDEDVVEKAGSVVFITGNPNFHPERVTAYDVGWRSQPLSLISLSVNAFYNDYTNLRSIEPAPVTFVPLSWGNFIAGDTYGAELWADVQVTSWWRLSPGARFVHDRLHFQYGASGLLGLAQAGDDPASSAMIKSAMNLGPRVTFDATFTHVASLPNPVVAAYYELYARIAWRLSNACELALEGSNLLQPRHQEFPAGDYIPRSAMAEVRWNF